ncbi:MAG TPA: alpha-amylase family protein, partial [Pyrinomonadaceae bacterium]|nr:alpha-amylase family protein [Pyrinomonadaceae bacterium]
LKTIGSAAVASAFPDVLLAATQQSVSVAVFWEAGFRAVQGCEVTQETLQQALGGFAVSFLNEQELIAQLNVERFDLLITPYGSAFPKRAWSVLLKYLRGGGNWLNIGGVPLSRPVVRSGSQWRVEAPQAAYHKQLAITHSFPVKGSAISKYDTDQELASLKADEIYELYFRLSSSNNEPDESGSDGPHEGTVSPLALGLNGDGRAIAAPVIQVDRLLADFAGGRWILANFSGSLDAKAIRHLAQIAALGGSRLEITSEFACYREHETPSFNVRFSHPKGEVEKRTDGNCRVELRDQSNQVFSQLNLRLDRESKSAFASFKLDQTKLRPGFYKISAHLQVNSIVSSTAFHNHTHTTGFWIYDPSPVTRGKPLTVDKHFFYRDGQVFPVTGATYMSSEKHRRFLFEPNCAVWDDDFRQMKEAGVNMIRTGIWTGWKKYMPEPGKVDEATLRAFDAFLLTAHKYDIPVIFTFFAFLPEMWGGENAYLDPRAIKAQQQFISAFTQRCRHIDDVMWDFINEPSFGSYKYIWSCRPNYDEHEKAAWKQWLRERYPAATDEEHVSKLRELWRVTTDDVLDLPRPQDFESVNLIDDRFPLKTLDYRLFAQDMFIRWVRQMTPAIKSNGNTKQLITVGQDENGLGDSPNPQFFANEIDFGSLHNWWNNDDLVWDSVLGKAPSKLNLMQETGVMFYEKSDGGAPWRSEEDVSNLLERKLALSFAADGAGFIEWVWNTNPYMQSTNEVGIGFHRVDSTAKPELEPFLRIAKFMSEHGQRLRDRVSEPVLMVIPHSQMFSPRSLAHEATRKCVRAMYYHCGVPMQAVSEYTMGEYAGQAKLIIVPSPRVLTDKCWEALVEEAKRGATVAISGPVHLDEHWRPASRMPLSLMSTRFVPVAESESINIGGREYVIRFEGDKMQRLEKQVIQQPGPVSVISKIQGAGQITWSTLPLELGDSMSAIVAFYKHALTQARIRPVFTALPQTPAVLVLPSVFRDVVLYTFVSETDRDTRVLVTHLESRTRFSVSVPAQRTAMVLLERKTGKLIGRSSV